MLPSLISIVETKRPAPSVAQGVALASTHQHTHTHSAPTMADGPGFNGDDPNCVYETPAALWASVEKDKDKAWYGEAVAYW